MRRTHSRVKSHGFFFAALVVVVEYWPEAFAGEGYHLTRPANCAVFREDLWLPNIILRRVAVVIVRNALLNLWLRVCVE
jgi:hypothetical protein